MTTLLKETIPVSLLFNGGTITTVRPGSLVDGDLMVMVFAFHGGGAGAGPSIGKPSGWNNGPHQGSFPAGQPYLWSYWKVASSEPASWNWGLGSQVVRASCGGGVWDGSRIDTSSIPSSFDQSVRVANDTSATIPASSSQPQSTLCIDLISMGNKYNLVTAPAVVARVNSYYGELPPVSTEELEFWIYERYTDNPTSELFSFGIDTARLGRWLIGSINVTADFVGAPLSGYSPLVVAFTDESVGNPSSWAWDFGDGYTSTSQNPIHTYTAVGTYDVSLTATRGGSDTKTRTSYVTVTSLPTTDVLSTAATIDHDVLAGVEEDQHHARAHDLAGYAHTGGFYVEGGASPEITDADFSLPTDGMVAMTDKSGGNKLIWVRTGTTWAAVEVD